MEQFTVQLNNATCTVCIGAGVLGRAGALLRRNLLVYGLGGIVVPFLGIKLIDLLLVLLGLS